MDELDTDTLQDNIVKFRLNACIISIVGSHSREFFMSVVVKNGFRRFNTSRDIQDALLYISRGQM